jgi:hypothetical protein
VLNQRIGAEPYTPEPLPAGTRVRVRCTLGSWASGFEVVGIDHTGYLLRRVSDGVILPKPIVATEVRES